MHVRIGIDGTGRLGRELLLAIAERPECPVRVVAVDGSLPVDALAALLRDPGGGRPRRRVEHDGRFLEIDGHRVRVTAHDDPCEVDRTADRVDIVVTAGGCTRETADRILANGPAAVVAARPLSGADRIVLFGLGDDDVVPRRHRVLAHADGLTTCAAMLLTALHDGFGVREAVLNAVLGPDEGTPDVDDPRLSRAAPGDTVPVATTTAESVVSFLPRLDGRVAGVALRVPAAGAALVQVTARLRAAATADQVDAVLAHAAVARWKGLMRHTTRAMVSSDVVGEPASCVVDAGLVRAAGSLVSVSAWTDLGTAPVRRTVDLVDLVARRLSASRRPEPAQLVPTACGGPARSAGRGSPG